MPVNLNILPTSGTPINPGGVRQLTIGEIALAKTLYGNAIQYHKVWVHWNSYLPFNLQFIDTAMTPDGEMWFRDGTYSPDFSLELELWRRYMFMHEMMHVWQAQKGMFVKTRGLISAVADYSYSLDKADLMHYGLEQQASIVTDYWLLMHYGFEENGDLHKFSDYRRNHSVYSLIGMYKNILKGFPG